MIDVTEDLKTRSLIDKNLENAIGIIRLKQSSNLVNLHVRMHLYENSCTLIIFDDDMWLTPYTHQGGNSSPTFIININKNPHVYDFYQGYFDKLWNDAVSVDYADTKDSLNEKLENRRGALSLL